jgi:fumarate reductase flavoprotein subunit
MVNVTRARSSVTGRRALPPGPFDAIVVGAGMAGSVGALRAQELGLRTLLIDKSEEPAADSNTVLSGGNLHLAYTHLLAPAPHLRERVESAIRGGVGSPELVSALLRSRRRAYSWLASKGVRFESDPSAGWRLWLAPYRPLVGVEAWMDRGPDITLRLLRERLVGLGGTVLGGAAALELIADEQRAVAGVVLRHRNGVFRVGAGGVLLADGGFQANSQLLTTHIGRFADRAKLRGAASGTGDGIRMAEPFRACLVGLQHFYGHLLHRDALVDDRLWPYPDLDPLLAHGALITRAGTRFCDEGLGGVASANATARLDDPRGAWIVADDVGWGSLRALSASEAAVYADRIGYFAGRGATLLEASTIDELADRASIDRVGLRASIDGLNAGVAARDGNRGAIPRTGLSTPIERPPFHAVPVVPGITFTMGGLLTDGSARVLDLDGRPITGLFAAGSTVGGLQGGPRGGYVGGLAPALIFGLVAGQAMARGRGIASGRRPGARLGGREA